MDTCTIEVGLLRKHPCGEKAVTKCANCEQALCVKHTVTTMSGGKKTMLCAECAKAWKKMGDVPDSAAVKKPEAPAAAPKPAPVAAKAATPQKPGAVKPVAVKKEEEKKPDDGPLEFTPSKK